MDRSIRALPLLAVLLAAALTQCAAPSASALVSATDAVVAGRIVLDGEPPEPQRWELDEEMCRVAGTGEYVDETWLVDPDGGVANCVVELRSLSAQASAPPAPLEGVVYAKVGPRYEPRVLAVPVGTSITFRNANSPCKGFVSSGRGVQVNMMLAAGSERDRTCRRAGVSPMECLLRPYMKGAIVVVKTPWYAVTGADGGFELAGVPPGEYEVRVWHEALGRVDPQRVRVAGGERLSLELVLPGP